MLTYDAESALVLLHDASSALLVDVTLCLDEDALLSVQTTANERPAKDRNIQHRWALERKGYVWVVGYLERADVSCSECRLAQLD